MNQFIARHPLAITLASLFFGSTLSFAPPAEYRLEDLASRLETEIGETLDYAQGEGTGEMARRLRQLSRNFAIEAETLGEDAYREFGLTLADLREAVLLTNGGPLVIPVINYRRAITHAQMRLRRAGIDFVEVRQHPVAEVTEKFRGYCGRVPDASITPQVLKRISRQLYPDEAENEITIPVVQSEIALGNSALEKRGVAPFVFRQAPEVVSDDEVYLPPFGAPLKESRASNARLALVRQWVGPPLALFGTAFGGGFAAPADAAGVVALGLERQFVTFSHKWAHFWDRFGFAGNVAVNAAYGVILTSTIMATSAALGLDSHVNLQEFFVKSFLIGTLTFTSSFGAMQIAASRLQHAGEYSEAGRFKLETYSVLWNNFGRVLALGAAGLGLHYHVGQIYDVTFGMGEVIGWSIQAAYMAAITAPMWLKMWSGDAHYDALTRSYFLSAGGLPQPPTWRGRVQRLCGAGLAWLADKYTPRRK